jgi:hypothetical protein
MELGVNPKVKVSMFSQKIHPVTDLDKKVVVSNDGFRQREQPMVKKNSIFHQLSRIMSKHSWKIFRVLHAMTGRVAFDVPTASDAPTLCFIARSASASSFITDKKNRRWLRA